MNDLVGKTFVKEHFGARQEVELVGVRRGKVTLREKGRVDSFTVTEAKFKKFYKLSQ
jgi:uncharacterized OB-fold protein